MTAYAHKHTQAIEYYYTRLDNHMSSYWHISLKMEHASANTHLQKKKKTHPKAIYVLANSCHIQIQ